VEGDLWWISDRTISDDFLLVGAEGLVLRFEPQTGRFEQLVPAGADLLQGAWGADDGHLWTVGGDLSNEESGGVVWVRDPTTEPQAPPASLRTSLDAVGIGGGQHLGGAQWSVDTEAPKVIEGGLPTLSSVWGADSSDVWAVGRDGVAIRFDGIRWASVAAGTTQPLHAVHGQGADVVAVGGNGSGVLLEVEAGRFVDRSPADVPQMNGVFVAPDGTAIAVGERGIIARRDSGGWSVSESTLDASLAYHAVWIDPQGGVWAVGGDLSANLADGVVGYAGAQDVNGEVAEDEPCPPSSLRGGNTTVSYRNEIQPLFDNAGCKTATCHGGAIPASGYSLSSWERVFGPGIEARALGLCDVVPGSPERSFLFEKIGPSPRFGVRMPDRLPPLSDEEVALVETWIREGAQDDVTPDVTPTPTATPPPTNTPAMGDCNDAGTICTVAGTGMSVFDGDGRDALLTSFYYPLDIVFQSDGLPIIDDWNNLRGRRIEIDGTVQTIIGTGFEANPEDGALATETALHHASELTFDPQGRLLVAGDHVPFVFRVGLDQRVEIVAGNGDFTTSGDGGPALEAGFVSPFGVLPDEVGGFWISDVDGHTIRNVDADGIVRRVAGTGTRGYSGDGGLAADAQLDGPTRMALDTAGHLIFCDTGNHVLRRIRTDGTIETFAGLGVPTYSGDGGPASMAGLSSPYDLAVTAGGSIYVADSRNNVVRLIQPDGTISTVVGSGISGFAGDRGPASEARLRQPSGLAFAPDGSLWIADTLNHRVRRVAGVVPTVRSSRSYVIQNATPGMG
jgi:hypothetical protein